MGKSPGVMLIELLIYLALFAFITVIGMEWITSVWTRSLAYEKKRLSLLNLSAAHDLLSHDLRYAPASSKSWKVQEPHELIWQQASHGDIGWVYEESNLFRSEGIYKKQEERWIKRTKNLVAVGVKNVIFTCPRAAEIKWIDVTLVDAHHTVDSRLFLLQRSIIWNDHADLRRS